MRGRWFVAAVVSVVLSSCATTETSTTASTASTEEIATAGLRHAVVTALADEVWIPSYLSVAETASSLEQSTFELCSDPTEQTLERARSDWLETRRAWITTRSFRFGPARDGRLESGVSFPVDPEKVSTLARSDSDDWSATLAGTGSDARGLEAIEIVLFTDLAPTGDDRHTCGYLQASAAVIATTAERIVEGWRSGTADEPSFRSRLDDDVDPQAVVELAVNDLSTTLEEITMVKLIDPVDGPSGTGSLLIADLLHAATLAYHGDTSGGLSKLVAEAFASTDERMTERLALAVEIADGLPPPLEQASVGQIDELTEAVTAIERTLGTEVASLLGATLMFGDTDGDS